MSGARIDMTATVKVSNISPKATEGDLWEFFAFSGEIQSIQVETNEESASQTAFVTFVEEKALDTALLLTGAVIVDRPVSVEAAVGYNPPQSTHQHLESAEELSSPVQSTVVQTNPPSATTERAQDVVSNLLAKGYILSKDAMSNAQALDEKHQLSKTASEQASVLRERVSTAAADLDRKMGLSQKISAGALTVSESFKSVDTKYGVTDKTRSAFATAEQKVNEAGAAFFRNSYVQSGSAWLSGAYGQVTKVATDVSKKTSEKVQQQEAQRGGLLQEAGHDGWTDAPHVEGDQPSGQPGAVTPAGAAADGVAPQAASLDTSQHDSTPVHPAANLL